MEIYLTDLSSGYRLQFPMLPEEIAIRTGTIFQQYTVIALGDIKLPAGDELRRFSWNGMLPGQSRQGEPYVTGWISPDYIHTMITSYWMSNRSKLRLLITNSPVNMNVYIEKFDMELSGGHGDYRYEIDLVEARDLVVRHPSVWIVQDPPPAQPPNVTVVGPTGGGGSNVSVVGPTDFVSTSGSVEAASLSAARPETPQPKTYTVVAGDTLWGIAQRFLGDGSRYGEIISANLKVLDLEAQKYGHKSSENGYWLFPGTVLTIPGGTFYETVLPGGGAKVGA